MGAVPGGGVLTAASGAWFDVHALRGSPRTAAVRRVTHPAVVLGSTQPATDVHAGRAAAGGVEVVRRRSGGGAVLVGPDDPVWVDVWLPRGDPLWSDDVVAAAGWVGEWWAGWLGGLGVRGLAVHRGASSGGPWARRICFAGVGPGEVTAAGRKVVGVAQWRCREGALFHTCAYRRWRPGPLADLLAVPAADRAVLAGHLGRAAVGVEELVGGVPPPDGLLASLPTGGAWSVIA
ncbi:MAG: lipoyl protein ligase domain-containing protein [Acidimicrobiales bacterium]